MQEKTTVPPWCDRVAGRRKRALRERPLAKISPNALISFRCRTLQGFPTVLSRKLLSEGIGKADERLPRPLKGPRIAPILTSRGPKVAGGLLLTPISLGIPLLSVYLLICLSPAVVRTTVFPCLFPNIAGRRRGAPQC